MPATTAYYGQDRLDDIAREEALITGNGDRRKKRPGGTPLHFTRVSQRAPRAVEVLVANLDNFEGEDLSGNESFGDTDEHPAVIQKEVNKILRAIPKEQREVLKLIYCKEYSIEQVARKRGLSIEEVEILECVGALSVLSRVSPELHKLVHHH